MPLLERAKSLFSPSPDTLAARELLTAVMTEARRPELYEEAGVADTIDGRFDLLTVHLYFVLRRLRSEGPAAQRLGQRLFDAAFANFDEALREMGVGDLSVGKKIRKMAQAFYGRLNAYETALGAPNALEDALVRNVYRGAQPTPAQIEALATALIAFRARVDAIPLDALLKGSLASQGAAA